MELLCMSIQIIIQSRRQGNTISYILNISSPLLLYFLHTVTKKSLKKYLSFNFFQVVTLPQGASEHVSVVGVTDGCEFFLGRQGLTDMHPGGMMSQAVHTFSKLLTSSSWITGWNVLTYTQVHHPTKHPLSKKSKEACEQLAAKQNLHSVRCRSCLLFW